jgi:hypothetical protein
MSPHRWRHHPTPCPTFAYIPTAATCLCLATVTPIVDHPNEIGTIAQQSTTKQDALVPAQRVTRCTCTTPPTKKLMSFPLCSFTRSSLEQQSPCCPHSMSHHRPRHPIRVRIHVAQRNLEEGIHCLTISGTYHTARKKIDARGATKQSSY